MTIFIKDISIVLPAMGRRTSTISSMASMALGSILGHLNILSVTGDQLNPMTSADVSTSTSVTALSAIKENLETDQDSTLRADGFLNENDRRREQKAEDGVQSEPIENVTDELESCAGLSGAQECADADQMKKSGFINVSK